MCKKILIVDDDEITTEIIAREIRKNFNVEHDIVYDAFEALRMIDTFQYCMVITDISLPGKSGHDIVRMCIDKSIPVMVITAYDPNMIFVDKKVNAYLAKPLDFDQLKTSIQGMLKVQDIKEIEYV